MWEKGEPRKATYQEAFGAEIVLSPALGFALVDHYQVTWALSLANYIDIFQQFFAKSNYALAIAQVQAGT